MAIKDLTKVDKHLFICNGGSCKKNGAEDTTDKIRNQIESCGLQEQIHTTKTLCNGRCDEGPIVISMPDNIWYKHVTPNAVDAFVESCLQQDASFDEHHLFDYTTRILHNSINRNQKNE